MDFDPREEKLPKWAREKLSALRNSLSSAEQYIKDLTSEIPHSEVRIDGYRIGGKYLPRGSRIAFCLDEEIGERREITAYVSGSELHLRGYTSVYVKPHLPNSISIGFTR